MKVLLSTMLLLICTLVNSQSLTGIWNSKSNTMEFKSDGSFIHKVGTTEYEGKYKFSAGNLNLKYNTGEKNYAVKEMNGDSFKLLSTDGKQEMLYTKSTNTPQKSKVPDIVESNNNNVTDLVSQKPTQEKKTEKVKPIEKELPEHKEVKEAKRKEVKTEEDEKETEKVDINRYRLGVRLLVPNIAGMHAEYVTPLLKNKISVAADYSYIPFSLFNPGLSGTGYKYFAFNTNMYLSNSKKGKGAYFGATYQKISGFIGDESVDLKGIGGVFGVKSEGPFIFGFEVGAVKPLGIGYNTLLGWPVMPSLNITLGYGF